MSTAESLTETIKAFCKSTEEKIKLLKDAVKDKQVNPHKQTVERHP